MALNQKEWAEQCGLAKGFLANCDDGFKKGLAWFQDPEKLMRDRRTAAIIQVLTTIFPIQQAVCAWAKSDGGDPIFVTRAKISEREKPLEMQKFRTMVTNAEDRIGDYLEPGGTVTDAKSDNGRSDPRIRGRAARFVRALHLDDLAAIRAVCAGKLYLFAPRLVVQQDMDVIARLAADGFVPAQIYLGFLRETEKFGLAGLVDVTIGHRAGLKQRITINALQINGWTRLADEKAWLMFIWTVMRAKGK